MSSGTDEEEWVTISRKAKKERKHEYTPRNGSFDAGRHNGAPARHSPLHAASASPHHRPSAGPSSSSFTHMPAPCRYFMQGHCRNGHLCHFLHENPRPKDTAVTSASAAHAAPTVIASPAATASTPTSMRGRPASGAIGTPAAATSASVSASPSRGASVPRVSAAVLAHPPAAALPPSALSPSRQPQRPPTSAATITTAPRPLSFMLPDAHPSTAQSTEHSGVLSISSPSSSRFAFLEPVRSLTINVDSDTHFGGSPLHATTLGLSPLRSFSQQPFAHTQDATYSSSHDVSNQLPLLDLSTPLTHDLPSSSRPRLLEGLSTSMSVSSQPILSSASSMWPTPVDTSSQSHLDLPYSFSSASGATSFLHTNPHSLSLIHDSDAQDGLRSVPSAHAQSRLYDSHALPQSGLRSSAFLTPLDATDASNAMNGHALAANDGMEGALLPSSLLPEDSDDAAEQVVSAPTPVVKLPMSRNVSGEASQRGPAAAAPAAASPASTFSYSSIVKKSELLHPSKPSSTSAAALTATATPAKPRSASTTTAPSSSVGPTEAKTQTTEHHPNVTAQQQALDDAFESEFPTAPDRRVCIYFLQGNCRYGRKCRYSHIFGEQCPNCGVKVGMTHREQEQHMEECLETKLMAEERKASAAIRCGLCNTLILESGNRFGLLSSCTHAFCLQCIREYRAAGEAEDSHRDVARACPLCRTESYYVIPCDRMVSDTARKKRVISQYIERLRRIPCMHYAKSKGNCPFGSSCFYAHISNEEEGSNVSLEQRALDLEEQRVVHSGYRNGSAHVVKMVQLSDFLF